MILVFKKHHCSFIEVTTLVQNTSRQFCSVHTAASSPPQAHNSQYRKSKFRTYQFLMLSCYGVIGQQFEVFAAKIALTAAIERGICDVQMSRRIVYRRRRAKSKLSFDSKSK